jgi:hypothetical protein
VIGTRIRGDDHRPLPALVSGHRSEESVRRGVRILEGGTEVLADQTLCRVAALEFDDRRARSVDGTHEHGGEFCRRLRMFGLEVLGGFDHAVHHP